MYAPFTCEMVARERFELSSASPEPAVLEDTATLNLSFATEGISQITKTMLGLGLREKSPLLALFIE